MEENELQEQEKENSTVIYTKQIKLEIQPTTNSGENEIEKKY